jgi:hypothetical protein
MTNVRLSISHVGIGGFSNTSSIPIVPARLGVRRPITGAFSHHRSRCAGSNCSSSSTIRGLQSHFLGRKGLSSFDSWSAIVAGTKLASGRGLGAKVPILGNVGAADDSLPPVVARADTEAPASGVARACTRSFLLGLARGGSSDFPTFGLVRAKSGAPASSNARSTRPHVAVASTPLLFARLLPLSAPGGGG